MRLHNLIIAISVLMFVPLGVFGQQVDPSVQPVDPSVNPRVQDVDRPGSPLLPGGSAAWTGQPIMSQASFAPTQKDSATGSVVNNGQFPSLGSMSAWGPAPVPSSIPNSDNASATPGVASATSKSDNNRVPSGSLAKKIEQYRKLDTLAADNTQSARSATIDDALVARELNQLTGASGVLAVQKLRRETARSTRSTRTKIYDPLRAKADAASAGRWQSDQSSDYALKQQQHETGALLQNGFYDRDEQRRRHHRRAHHVVRPRE